MRSLRVSLVLVLALGALVVASSGAGSEPERTFAGGDDDGDDDEGDDGEGSSGPIGDFTFGEGTAQFPVGTSTFSFAAESGPGGENAIGFADATSAFGVHFAGPVTCLSVSGNRAAFEVDSNDPFDVVFFVGDNGPAGMGDEFNFHPLGVADSTCPAPMVSEQSVVAGDIEVHDNEPLPGSGDGDDDDDGDDD